MFEQEQSHDLDYAAPPAPVWSGAVSAAVGAFAALWLSAGLTIFLLSDDPAAGAKAMKLVLLACVPSTLVGFVLGLAARAGGGRWALVGISLNGLALLTAAGFLIFAYATRLAD